MPWVTYLQRLAIHSKYCLCAGRLPRARANGAMPYVLTQPATARYDNCICSDDIYWVCKPSHLVPAPSQDKLGGCGRKGIRGIQREKWGIREVGHWLVRMEWCPAGLSVYLPLISLLAPSPEEAFPLAPAHPGSPRKTAMNGCVCVMFTTVVHLKQFSHKQYYYSNKNQYYIHTTKMTFGQWHLKTKDGHIQHNVVCFLCQNWNSFVWFGMHYP